MQRNNGDMIIYLQHASVLKAQPPLSHDNVFPIYTFTYWGRECKAYVHFTRACHLSAVVAVGSHLKVMPRRFLVFLC